MALVKWSAAAKQDLAAIRDYYESSSPGYTRAVISKLYEAVSRLEKLPHMGRMVPELESETFRELIVEGYRIVYLVVGKGEAVEVDVLAIAHSRQDLAKKLSRR
jgi:addiction module RelE/StbE family toxin